MGFESEVCFNPSFLMRENERMRIMGLPFYEPDHKAF
jgi:hypothetical protein